MDASLTELKDEDLAEIVDNLDELTIKLINSRQTVCLAHQTPQQLRQVSQGGIKSY
jgi:hypothetical protein